MIRYKMELKPIKALGVSKLPADKLQIFQVSLKFIVDMLNLHEKITKAEAQQDFSILIEAEEEMAEELERLHEASILTRLS